MDTRALQSRGPGAGPQVPDWGLLPRTRTNRGRALSITSAGFQDAEVLATLANRNHHTRYDPVAIIATIGTELRGSMEQKSRQLVSRAPMVWRAAGYDELWKQI